MLLLNEDASLSTSSSLPPLSLGFGVYVNAITGEIVVHSGILAASSESRAVVSKAGSSGSVYVEYQSDVYFDDV